VRYRVRNKSFIRKGQVDQQQLRAVVELQGRGQEVGQRASFWRCRPPRAGPAPVIVPTACFWSDTRAVDPNACVPFFQLRGFEGKFVSRHSTP
jgi:hypothetical protein